MRKRYIYPVLFAMFLMVQNGALAWYLSRDWYSNSQDRKKEHERREFERREFEKGLKKQEEKAKRYNECVEPHRQALVAKLWREKAGADLPVSKRLEEACKKRLGPECQKALAYEIFEKNHPDELTLSPSASWLLCLSSESAECIQSQKEQDARFAHLSDSDLEKWKKNMQKVNQISDELTKELTEASLDHGCE